MSKKESGLYVLEKILDPNSRATTESDASRLTQGLEQGLDSLVSSNTGRKILSLALDSGGEKRQSKASSDAKQGLANACLKAPLLARIVSSEQGGQHASRHSCQAVESVLKKAAGCQGPGDHVLRCLKEVLCTKKPAKEPRYEKRLKKTVEELLCDSCASRALMGWRGFLKQEKHAAREHAAHEERREDPILGGKAVTFLQMCESHCNQNLSKDQLEAHWSKLPKAQVDNQQTPSAATSTGKQDEWDFDDIDLGVNATEVTTQDVRAETPHDLGADSMEELRQRVVDSESQLAEAHAEVASLQAVVAAQSKLAAEQLAEAREEVARLRALQVKTEEASKTAQTQVQAAVALLVGGLLDPPTSA